MKINVRKMVSLIALILCPVITFYLFDFYTHNPFISMDVKTQFLNIIFYELMGVFLFGVCKSLRVALMLQTGFFMIAGLVNFYVVRFRAAPIRAWDILSIRTAAGVADNYSYELEKDTIFILVAFLVLLVVESRFKLQAPAKLWKRVVLIVAPALLIWAYTEMIQNDTFVLKFGLYDKYFTPTVMSKMDGNVVAFLMSMEYVSVEKPKAYSAEETEKQYIESGEKSEGLVAALQNPESVKRPNIIVIMDEAFSDLSVLGEMVTSEDYMPYIHSLQKGAENTITGMLNVSVLGGNTANTEFEFLTGNTMAFLPQGSVAYQQYMQDEVPSLAAYLKELGYHTVAMHPYNAGGWDRDTVYPMLGFDTFLSLKNFGGAEKLRKYVSDASCFDKIIDLYEEKEGEEPLFVFNVTMQNHSGYTEDFDNFTPDITIQDITAKSLPMYLSLIKRTDQAFEELVRYFEGVSEDTMIVFFGDHQPTTYVSNPILRSNGVDPNTITEEETLLKYKVPYIIWSNFDIEEGTGQETSVNYLAIDVLEQCGLPLPAYQNSLKELRREYPIVSAMQVRDKDGNYYSPEECRERLRDYHSLQYYLLFD